MADAEDSKSSVRKHMRVQVPPSAIQKKRLFYGHLMTCTLARPHVSDRLPRMLQRISRDRMAMTIRTLCAEKRV
jgi:hypothetical protein